MVSLCTHCFALDWHYLIGRFHWTLMIFFFFNYCKFEQNLNNTVIAVLLFCFILHCKQHFTWHWAENWLSILTLIERVDYRAGSLMKSVFCSFNKVSLLCKYYTLIELHWEPTQQRNLRHLQHISLLCSITRLLCLWSWAEKAEEINCYL